MAIATKGQKRKLEDQVDDLIREIRGLRAERGDLKTAAALEEEIRQLRQAREVELIEAARKTEAHDREKRDIEHMVGLEKKRQEVEIEQAKKEATLAVREENLQADRERFEENMKFVTERFGKETEYLKDIMGDILERLPHVNVDKRVKDGAA